MDGVGIDHRYHDHHQHLNHGSFTTQRLPPQAPRKRKADGPPENNERLSKRLSLLNLEQSGQKLYVPVENSPSSSTTSKPHKHNHHPHHPADDSLMQLDDTKHKVYIYNLDDELSPSSSDAESDTNDSKLIFLTDIDKHLRATSRIPRHILEPRRRPDENSAAAELEGKQLVLYGVPSSLSVPAEQDSVRKAILEVRERARERQRAAVSAAAAVDCVVPVTSVPTAAAASALVDGPVPMDAELLPVSGDDDLDAMELD